MAQTSNFGKEWWDRTPLFEIAVIGGIITAFFEAFRFLFSAITYYYSRQLEYRADAVAAQVAGNTNFHNGLKKYSAFSDFFNTIGMNSIVSLLEEDRVYINIYEAAYTDYVRRDIRKIEKETIAADKWSMRSTHPTLARRLKRIAPSDKPANTSSAILLIGNHSDFEEFLTKELTNHIANQQWLQYEYDQALAREGRCRYCGEQYEKLNELLEHEEHCEHSRKQPRRRTTKRK